MRKIASVLFAALMVLRCMDDDQHAGVCSETQNQCGGTAAVTGQVLDPAGRPAAGAEVELFFRSGDIAKRSAAPASGADVAYAKGRTDADGRYAFRRLPAGDWLMKCVKDTLGITQSFNLREGERTEAPPAALVNTGIILGRVDRSIVQQGVGNVAILNEIGQQANITVNGDFVFNNVPVYNTYTITIVVGDKTVPNSGLQGRVVKMEPGKTLSVDSTGVKDVTGQVGLRFVVPDTTVVAGDTVNVVPQFTSGKPAAYNLSLSSRDSAIVTVSGSRITAVKAGTVQVTATVAGAEAPYTFKVVVLPVQDAWRSVFTLAGGGRVVHADFVDADVGFAVATNRRVLKTRDGGATWDTLRIQSGSGTYGPVAVEAVDAEVVYVVTQHPAGVLRSANGGVNWDSTFTGPGDLAGAQFLDRDRGFVWGDRGVYWTRDGARTFARLDSGATVVQAKFLGPDTGYIALDDNKANTILVKRTFDGGKTWTTSTFPSSTLGKAEGLAVRDAGTAVLVGESGNSRGVGLMTTDSGATWTPIALPAPMTGIVGSAAFLPDGGLFLAGYTGSSAHPTVVARSADRGRTWVTERFDGVAAFYQNVQFVSGTTAFAWSAVDGVIRRTDTGGFATNR